MVEPDRRHRLAQIPVVDMERRKPEQGQPQARGSRPRQLPPQSEHPGREAPEIDQPLPRDPSYRLVQSSVALRTLGRFGGGESPTIFGPSNPILGFIGFSSANQKARHPP